MPDDLTGRSPRFVVQAICARLLERASGGTALASPDFRWGWHRAIEAIEEDFLGIPMPEVSRGQPGHPLHGP